MCVWGGGGGGAEETDRQADRQRQRQVKRARKCLNFVSLFVELVLLTMELQSY